MNLLRREIEKGNINAEQFTKEQKQLCCTDIVSKKRCLLLAPSVKLLSTPENYTVKVIPSGCCGMAGSFGYEKEHYDLSMKIGDWYYFLLFESSLWILSSRHPVPVAGTR